VTPAGPRAQVRTLPDFNDLLALVDSLRHTLVMGAVLLFLLTLTCFIFAVAGVQLFGPMCTPKDRAALPPRRALRCLLAGDAAVLSDVFNFQNIVSGMLVFFRVSLVDGWTTLLAALSTGPLPRAPEAVDTAAGLLAHYLASLNGTTAERARSAPLRARLMKQAQALLPGCQTEGELAQLAAAGVVVRPRPPRMRRSQGPGPRAAPWATSRPDHAGRPCLSLLMHRPAVDTGPR
jgi:hypothetical protein